LGPQAVLAEKHEAVLQRLHRAEAALAQTTRDYILGDNPFIHPAALQKNLLRPAPASLLLQWQLHGTSSESRILTFFKLI
jgi:hypothetical protein